MSDSETEEGGPPPRARFPFTLTIVRPRDASTVSLYVEGDVDRLASWSPVEAGTDGADAPGALPPTTFAPFLRLQLDDSPPPSSGEGREGTQGDGDGAPPRSGPTP